MRSRKEFKVLTPGGGFGAVLLGCRAGGGGGAGHGDFAVEEDADAFEDVEGEGEGVGEGVSGAVAPGTAASFLSLSIFSLYASFNSNMSFIPCSFAFDSSFSLYFAIMRSCVPCVARKRTSWTRAQRRWQMRGFVSG